MVIVITPPGFERKFKADSAKVLPNGDLIVFHGAIENLYAAFACGHWIAAYVEYSKEEEYQEKTQ